MPRGLPQMVGPCPSRLKWAPCLNSYFALLASDTALGEHTQQRNLSDARVVLMLTGFSAAWCDHEHMCITE